MSQPTVIYWAPVTGNTAVISSLQNYSGAGNLTLNSNVPNSPISNNGPYVYDGVARTVSFTSANNLSARTITITGIGSAVDANGNPTQSLGTVITETLSGPNANTVNSAKIYKQIDSISINGAANALSVGFGASGIGTFTYTDYDRTGWYASCQTAVYNRTTLTHTVYLSLTKPETIDYKYGNLIAYPQAIPTFPLGAVDSAVSQLLAISIPVVLAWVNVKATAGDSMYFTVLQQGIRS